MKMMNKEDTLFNMEIQFANWIQQACNAAIKAGQAILAEYGMANFDLQYKPDDSPLTRADAAAHDIIAQELQASGLPILSEEGAGIPYAERCHWKHYWLVDPLDGTKEFISRNGEFTVNIALMDGQQPIAGVVYAPVQNLLYYGSKATGVYKCFLGQAVQLYPMPERVQLRQLIQRRGITIVASRSHRGEETDAFIGCFTDPVLRSLGSSLKLLLLADGEADIYPRLAPTMEWDTAAAHALLLALNRGVYLEDGSGELVYNKPDLRNPSFIAY